MKYDFGGWATKNDLRCSDGRVIRHGAFKDCDGQTVPLVWQHMHDSPDNILGHALLENRDEGVYAYCTFNDTPSGQQAKGVVKHGDVNSLSIYANRLKQQGSDVIHGAIREVSLVLTGAYPGAVIDNLAFVHSDGYEDPIEDEAIIYNGFELYHADDEEDDVDEEEVEEMKKLDEDDDDEKVEHEGDEKTIGDVFETLNEEQKQAVYALIGLVKEGDAVEHAEGDEAPEEVSADEQGGETLKDIFETFTDEEKEAVYAVIGMSLNGEQGEEPANDEGEEEMAQSGLYHADDGPTIQEIFDNMDDQKREAAYAIIGLAVEKAGQNGGKIEHSYEEDTMKRNVFDETGYEGEVLSHEETQAIFADAQRYGSLRDAVLQHGIENIDVFFPDYQNVGEYPAMISRPMDWVAGVLSDVHKTPFSKVRSIAANITAEEARAKGYIKGEKKIEEQISALKRETTPQTIYKLQKLDRDDIIDITDFDVVAWLKQEMRVMLDEEVARAILVGDGRLMTSKDKIKEENIRPIWTDVETYTLHTTVDKTLTGQERAEAFIDSAIRARKDYRGTGSPALYVGTDLLTEMRLIRDKMGHRLYKNDQELADELRVSKIVEIQLLDGLTRKDSDSNEFEFGGLIVNLNDYNCGSTKGGEVNLFDDFDLDYNKYEYLIETRLSGALYVPMSAMAIEFGTVSTTSEPAEQGNG